ncbi:MAG: hypothetical protein PHS14_14225 [Elusimicrobia bacterium]|nr:hypothetical protein [Elusimicrobiota bacterium]
MSTPLPPDMAEHSSTIAGWLVGALTLLGGAFALLWRTREKDKENQVAAALRELGAKVEAFGTKFDETVLRIFDKIDRLEHENRQRDVRCAALHGKGPDGWDGHERRQKPR